MMTTGEIIREMEASAAELGIAPTTLGQLAVRNSKLYNRLRAGGKVTTTTVERLREFVAEERVRRAKPKQ